jgi:Right handed beta helix region
MHAIRSAFGRVSLLPRIATVVALAALTLGAAASVASASKQVNIVSQGEPPATIPKHVTYFKTIQAAVNAVRPGGWVLIEPGVYDEEVKVTKSNIFIRGMNRNEVIVDGQEEKLPGGRNGIEVYKANNVWIENLTVRNFEREELNGAGGNEIWWNGGAESGHVGAHGWYGSYLTAYDTGLDGGYGIFTGNETEGEWNNIYASGFNDSGIYIGACPECKARVNHATMEYNALGYSGSNSGGNLVIENSVFSHNTTGIAPNSENPGDGPPPQNGACEHSKPLHRHIGPDGQTNWRGQLPEFTSTEFAHCTIIRDNVISDNNDLNLPANTSAAAAPWGAGIELPGDYGDLVEHNTITGNPSDGVLAFEYPNPYQEPKQEEEDHVATIDFQNAGNKVVDNTFSDNGYLGGAYAGDVAFEGGVFGTQTSTNNCISDNTYEDATYPADIEGTWGCQNKTTPNPGGGLPFVIYLLELQAESENRPSIEPVPAPPAQPTMPEPCAGVPAGECP